MLVRIHALYDRNLRLLVSVLGISLPLLAFIFVSTHQFPSTPELRYGSGRSSAKAGSQTPFLGYPDAIRVCQNQRKYPNTSDLAQNELILSQFLTCVLSPRFSVFDRQRILDLAAAWEALFLYDTMMFGLTVFKTYSTWCRTDLESSNLPIHRLILRDGASSAFFFLARHSTYAADKQVPYISGEYSSASMC